VHWVEASVLVGREVLCGLALGFALRLLFLSLQLAGRMIERQMGFALAQIIDPMTGEQAQTVGIFFEITFALLFLVAGGHRLLLLLIARSYDVFPVGMAPDSLVMAEGVVKAGSAMLLFALQLVAPMLAAFMVLSVILAILARVLPEMNILLASLPLRVGLGFFMAAAIMPLMSSVISQIARWMQQMLIT
jgi:flagellar biosynthetic protein FliR